MTSIDEILFMKTKFLLAIFTFALLGATVPATTVVPPSFDQLVEDAQLIFEGKVTDVRCEWAGQGAERVIVSYVTFEIEDALKGSPGTNVTLRLLGGTIGNETITIADAPVFQKGDRDILFVENNGSQFIPLVGIMHGRFRVQPDGVSGIDIVTDYAGHSLGQVSPVAAAEFKKVIRAKLATSPR